MYYKDYSFCDIQTWDEIDEEIIAHTPYCQRTTYWDGYMITVPKFGELTDEDISKAIGYVLRCIERESISFFTLYNTYLDGVHIKVNWFDDYKYVEDMLRDKKLRTRAIKTKEKDV